MPDSNHGLLLDVIGPERGGKSDFACTVAEVSSPCHYLAFDHNYLSAVKRHQARGLKIIPHTFFYSLPFTPPVTGHGTGQFKKKTNAIRESVVPAWREFKRTLKEVLSEPNCSVVIDNGTKLHYACRLALWGYVHKVARHLYPARTSEMSTILNELRYSNKDIVLIHQWSEVWEDDEPTGDFERAGSFGPVAYEVMATLAATRDTSRTPTRFQVEVLDSTFSETHNGLKFRGKHRTFAEVKRVLMGEDSQ